MKKIIIPTDIRITKDNILWNTPKIFLIVGVISLVLWLIGCSYNYDRALFSYLFSYISILGIALGSIFFVLIQHVTRAGWSVVVRRVPETAMRVLPLFALLFIPIAIGVNVLYPWTDVKPDDFILIEKVPYLNISFFAIRSIFYLAIWSIIGVWFHKKSIEQDTESNQAEIKKVWYFSAPALIIMSLTTSFASFDWLMSMQPHWFSTIFGIYFFGGNFLTSFAFMTVIYMILQRYSVLKTAVTKEHYHDLGKYIFGFTIFWAYIAFSQFMLYWYANVPEETEFYIHRLHHGWDTISYMLSFTNFFIPFFILLSRHAKRNTYVLFLSCLWTIFFHFVDIYWLVMPNYNGSFSISFLDITSLVGIFSIFMACFGYLLRKHNVIPIKDTRLKESLLFENF